MDAAWIVLALRTPIGKAPHGSLTGVRPDELLAGLVREALARLPGLPADAVDDVVVGCAVPEAEQGGNLGRLVALGAGLPVEVPGLTVNRYCASSLEAVALAARAVATGEAKVVVAAGVESMSRTPMWGYRPSPHLEWAQEHPDYYLAMGLTAEEVASAFGVRREDQDVWALRSHLRAARAEAEGRFRDEIVPVSLPDGTVVARDEGIRRDTSLRRLAELPPVFRRDGTVTAGNSSPMSDGAAVAVVAAERCLEAYGLVPLARVVSYAVAGVEPRLMGVGPVRAVPKALRLASLSLDDIDLVELNEAFAAQVVAVVRALGLPEERVNVNGGAIALGHPLGATGIRLLATGLHELIRRGDRRLLATLCIGGGMGAAMVLERPKAPPQTPAGAPA